jgi:inorganic triphosphatase YgiF
LAAALIIGCGIFAACIVVVAGVVMLVRPVRALVAKVEHMRAAPLFKALDAAPATLDRLSADLEKIEQLLERSRAALEEMNQHFARLRGGISALGKLLRACRGAVGSASRARNPGN